MDPLGKQRNLPRHDQVVVADSVDENIVERENTDNGKQTEYNRYENIHGPVPRALFPHSYLFFGFFLCHFYFSSPFSGLSGQTI